MDDVDLTTLATRICAGLDGVRACLLLSGDGLTLGVHPSAGEARARDVWGRLQEAGDPVRGFVDVGEEVWVVLRRGPYTGVLVAAPGAKAGLLLDKLEFMLRTAEEARARDATATATAPARPEGARRPRAPLHREDAPAAAPEKAPAPKAEATQEKAAPPTAVTPATSAGTSRRRRAEGPRYAPPDLLEGAAQRVVDITEADGDPQPEPTIPPAPPAPPGGGAADEDTEVDRVALAGEFRQLLGDSNGLTGEET
jgi:hypothetical protein